MRKSACSSNAACERLAVAFLIACASSSTIVCHCRRPKSAGMDQQQLVRDDHHVAGRRRRRSSRCVRPRRIRRPSGSAQSAAPRPASCRRARSVRRPAPGHRQPRASRIASACSVLPRPMSSARMAPKPAVGQAHRPGITFLLIRPQFGLQRARQRRLRGLDLLQPLRAATRTPCRRRTGCRPVSHRASAAASGDTCSSPAWPRRRAAAGRLRHRSQFVEPAAQFLRQCQVAAFAERDETAAARTASSRAVARGPSPALRRSRPRPATPAIRGRCAIAP